MVDGIAPKEKQATLLETEHNDHLPGADTQVSSNDIEQSASHDLLSIEDVVTPKTWAVVAALSASYGISFWPVPFFSQIQGDLTTSFGSSVAYGTWFTSVYTIALTISFMICGANSDLFGRRYFILLGNICVFIGAIIGATSHSVSQSICAHTVLGFGGGNCQLATFTLSELLPNKWRHIGVILADGLVFFVVTAGPALARIAIAHGDAWRWGYYGQAIAIAPSFAFLALFYYPPKHPRGIPWGRAFRILDHVGIVLFTISVSLILSGIVYVQYRPASDPIVYVLLTVGFVCLIAFTIWETVANLEAALTPRHIFTHNKGRTMAAPFIVGMTVTMFYYGTNIIYQTMVSVEFSSSSTNTIYWLSTVQGFGTIVGAAVLWLGGNYFQRWPLQLGLSITWMTLFGGLMAYITPARLGLAVAFTFLGAAGFGHAQYLSITYVQFGAKQIELGIAGGLAGVARSAGGAIAVTTFQTILAHVQTHYASNHVVPAAEAAGASPAVANAVAAALPSGTAALDKISGLTPAIATAAGEAFTESYVQGLKTVSLTLMGFGGLGAILCLFLEDIGEKMNNKIEIFLENDVYVEKNQFH